MRPVRIAAAGAALLLCCCPAAAADPVVVAAGDIACDPTEPAFKYGQGVYRPGHGTCHHLATARLIGRLRADRVLMLGDAQYRDGLYNKFLVSYGGPGSWGRFLPITRPVPGNHDYGLHRKRYDPAAAGYYRYFEGRWGHGSVATTPPRAGTASTSARATEGPDGRPAGISWRSTRCAPA